MINISFSSIGAFMRCPYSFYMNYVLKEKVKISSPAMQLGSAIDDYLGGDKPNLNDCSDETKGKARAMIKAIKDLKLGFRKSMGYDPQKMFKKKIKCSNQDVQLIGFADFFNHKTGELVELKTTSRVDYYQTLFNINDQVSMYIMALKGVKSVRLATVQTPKMKMTKHMTMQQYIKKVYDDIMDRPDQYFYGVKSDGSFGKEFSVGQFTPNNMKKSIFYVLRNIEYCTDKDYWPRNKGACSNNGYSDFKCNYCDVCYGKAD